MASLGFDWYGNKKIAFVPYGAWKKRIGKTFYTGANGAGEPAFVYRDRSGMLVNDDVFDPTYFKTPPDAAIRP